MPFPSCVCDQSHGRPNWRLRPGVGACRAMGWRPGAATGVKIGPLELKVQEKETVNVPLIVSAGVIVPGVFLLVVGRK